MLQYDKIQFIGSSGSHRKEVIKRLFERDYVVIVARNPEKFSAREHVEIVKGDVTSDLSQSAEGRGRRN